MKEKRIIITGSAGFIGSHLAELMAKKHDVLGIDNFSSGKLKPVPTIRADLLCDSFEKHLEGADAVFHLAANPDVRLGAEDTKVHVAQNILVTHNVLEAARKSDVAKIIFTSSSTVYGNAKMIPTPEDYSPLEPVSIYGASKLSCEALISSYCHLFGMQGWIFRLANIIGPGSSHGIVPDFVRKLQKNPHELEILGDGSQNKSYMYIDDCISAMSAGFENSRERLNIFNLGSLDQINVKDIADIVCREMNVAPAYRFTGGKGGWNGDVPVMMLDISRISSCGWKPQYSSREAVRKTVLGII